MTILDQAGDPSGRPGQYGQAGQSAAHSSPHNVGEDERVVSVVAGSILAVLGISRASVPGLIVAGVGGAMIHRGVTGYCHVSAALGIDTSDDKADGSSGPFEQRRKLKRDGLHVEETFLINRPAEQLYQFWRNFENLPRIMSHLKSVSVIDERRSHWVAEAPRIAGGQVEWDAEITTDEPNARIAWRSLEGADVSNTGEVRFAKALGDRGTEVHVSIAYIPPAGRLGGWIAKLFGTGAERQVREDLRQFRQIMELGEVMTIDGQPHGTCAGRGKLAHEPPH